MMEIICNGLEDRREKNEWKNGEEAHVEHTEKPGIVANFGIWKVLGGLRFTFLLRTSNKMLI